MNTTHTSWYKKAIVGTVSLFTLLISSVGATDLLFNLPLSLQGGTFLVQFGGGGNDYLGSLILSSQTAVNATVNFPGYGPLNCKRQLHGYYYNAARGAGLLPLSTSSNTAIDGMTVNGGLFTSCGQGVRLYDIVGALHYTYNGGSMGSLFFGLDTDLTNNTLSSNYLPGAIQWRVTNGINGRFFDSMFGIGIVNSSINSGATIGSISNLIGTFTNIYIQGQAGIGKSVDIGEREILSVNLAGTKTILTSNDEANSSKVISAVNQNISKQCKSFEDKDRINYNNKTICIDANNGTFTINAGNFNQLKNKDIVIKNGNLFIDRSIYKSTNSSNALSVFVLDGYLVFDSNVEPSDLSDIDKNGFLTREGGVTQGVYLEGNFVVNGLILGSTSDTITADTVSTIPFKTYIHGKLVSLNTMTTVSNQRIKHLTSLLEGRLLTYQELSAPQRNNYFKNNTWDASLGSVFSWQCDDKANNGMGQGEKPQGFLTGSSTAITATSINCPVGHRYPLTITDKYIPSLILN